MSEKRQAELANELYADLRRVRDMLHDHPREHADTIIRRIDLLYDNYRCEDARRIVGVGDDSDQVRCDLLMEHEGPHRCGQDFEW